MTLQEAADACRLHHTTLRKAIREGRLLASRPTGRDIRITSSAIEQWLEATCTRPQTR
ncbi:helix-turn-helix domain-containing protein [Nannocystis punicea]|uniref:Helix-turn-helix domain-containing protein n=1 Tax=Nannocystis punicea TaxID=2995304 RepID=A0ABY7GY84_9BACT|nr:helix-turn-helix domain-containing protein [Nannocystis poenicansa]WAS91834.1 helix-turn-helix domain-containing protein [Nannocystis poenicansa]